MQVCIGRWAQTPARIGLDRRAGLSVEPVTTSGRVELRYYVQEQAVSMTLHRFGNPSRDFHELAAALTS